MRRRCLDLFLKLFLFVAVGISLFRSPAKPTIIRSVANAR